MSQTAPPLPDPPPTWRRLLRLPPILAREARGSAARRWRSLGWRVRHGHRVAPSLARAWSRTDPHHLERVMEAWRARIAATPPAPLIPPPPAGTQARLMGHLSGGGGGLGEWTLDERAPLEEAITGALGLDPRSVGCDVEITVRVLGESAARSGPGPGPVAAGTQQRPITVAQCHELARIGVLGETGVELIDGWLSYGSFPFALAPEAIAAARAAGIDLTTPEPPGAPPASGA